MTDLIGVYGAAGCGRGILPILRLQHPNAELVFVDDGDLSASLNGHPVIAWDAFRDRPAGSKAICLAIASGRIREKLWNKCTSAGVPLAEARAASVVEMDDVVIGEGACLSPFVTLTSNIRIGRSFHANLYSYVEHDCRIGDFVTLAPGAKINGNVTVADHGYVGSGAVIRQGLSIGAHAVVGMGAVVTKNVPAGVTVVGNPARPLTKA